MSNPYDDLGVERDATEKEIKAAFLQRAKKAHPDAGGSVDEFARLSQSKALLLNPKARARYDSVGDDSGPDIDNDFSLVTNRIMNYIFEAISQADQGGMDPTTIDIIAYARNKFLADQHNIKVHNDTIRNRIGILRRVSARALKKQPGVNIIAKGIMATVKDMERSLADSTEEVRLIKLAVEMLKDYSFDTAKSYKSGYYGISPARTT